MVDYSKYKKINFRGKNLWILEQHKEAGGSPLLGKDMVNASDGIFTPAGSFDGVFGFAVTAPATMQAFPEALGVWRFRQKIGEVSEIADGWLTEETNSDTMDEQCKSETKTSTCC